MAKRTSSRGANAEGNAAVAARKQILRDIVRAGWMPSTWPDVDPDEPGAVWRAWVPDLPAECVATFTYPELPSYLGEPDIMGIKWELGCLRLCSRFLRGRAFSGGSATETSAMAPVLLELSLHYIVAQLRPRAGLEPPALLQERARLNSWRAETLAPANISLRALGDGQLDARNFRACEPASTLAILVKKEGLIDVDADMRAMASALGMFVKGSRKARPSKGVGLNELIDLHQFITRDGRCVTGFSPTGKFVLRELDAKSALDSDAGSVVQTKRDRSREVKAATLEDPSSKAALDALAAQDALAAIETLVEQMRAEAKWTPAQQIALEFAMPFYRAEFSVADVARAKGVPEPTLRFAWQHVRGLLRARVVAEYPGLAAAFAEPCDPRGLP